MALNISSIINTEMCQIVTHRPIYSKQGQLMTYRPIYSKQRHVMLYSPMYLKQRIKTVLQPTKSTHQIAHVQWWKKTHLSRETHQHRAYLITHPCPSVNGGLERGLIWRMAEWLYPIKEVYVDAITYTCHKPGVALANLWLVIVAPATNLPHNHSFI